MPVANTVLAKLALIQAGPAYYIFNYDDSGFDLGLDESVRQASGTTGHRADSSGRERPGERSVSGSIPLFVTPSDLDVLLPFITGGTKTGNNFPLTNVLPTFDLLYRRDVKDFKYTSMKVNTATFSASKGQFLKLNLGVVGADETAVTGITLKERPDGVAPYVMEDCVLTVGGTAYPFESFTASISHNLAPRFYNNLSPQRYIEGKRNTGVQLQFPYGDSQALYGLQIAAATVLATFTNGTNNFSIQLNNVSIPRQKFTSDGNEFMLPWNGRATETVAANGTTITPEIVFTNV